MTPMGGHLNKEVEVEPPLSPPPPPPPQPSSGHKAAIGELVKSQELLKKLGTVVSDMPAAATEGGLVLVREAMKSITVAINALQGGAKATEAAGSMGSGDGRSENSGVVKRKCRKDAAVEKKRDSKRRRSTEASCRRITSKSLEDGYAWRKYGQKEIQNAKNPRSYFKCTHKLDRGCQATRQAQRSEVDPSVYHITYFGQHTCMDSLKPHKSGSNDPTFRELSYIINFGSLEQSQINPSPSITPLRGHNQDILSTNLSQKGSSSEPFPEPVLAPPETSMPTTTIDQVSDVVSEHGDVTSRFHASMGLQMEFMNDDSLFANICGEFEVDGFLGI